MSYILVGFSHDASDWISRIMAKLSYGDYSHVVIVSPCEKFYIEATAVKKPPGVQPPRPIELFLHKPGAVIRKIPHPNPEGAWEAAVSQVGKGYDWMWIWGRTFLQRDWQKEDKWSCSELFEWAARIAGKSVLAGDNQWHITPSDIYAVSIEI